MPEYQFDLENVNQVYIVNGTSEAIRNNDPVIALVAPAETAHTVEYNPATKRVIVVFRDDVKEKSGTGSATDQILDEVYGEICQAQDVGPIDLKDGVIETTPLPKSLPKVLVHLPTGNPTQIAST